MKTSANLLSLSFLLLAAAAVGVTAQNASTDIIPSLVQSQGPAPRLPRPKLTHLRFYWHDVVSGRDPSSIQVADAPSSNASATGFGLVMMFDNPITLSPSPLARPVGRAQGFYASAGKNETALLMTMNIVFFEGAVNGSSLAVLGRNAAVDNPRDLPVVGGTGVFRLARGRCELRTHFFNATTGDATVRYDVFARHY